MEPGGSQAFLTTSVLYMTSYLQCSEGCLFVQSDMVLNCLFTSNITHETEKFVAFLTRQFPSQPALVKKMRNMKKNQSGF